MMPSKPDDSQGQQRTRLHVGRWIATPRHTTGLTAHSSFLHHPYSYETTWQCNDKTQQTPQWQPLPPSAIQPSIPTNQLTAIPTAASNHLTSTVNFCGEKQESKSTPSCFGKGFNLISTWFSAQVLVSSFHLILCLMLVNSILFQQRFWFHLSTWFSVLAKALISLLHLVLCLKVVDSIQLRQKN